MRGRDKQTGNVNKASPWAVVGFRVLCCAGCGGTAVVSGNMSRRDAVAQ